MFEVAGDGDSVCQVPGTRYQFRMYVAIAVPLCP